MINKYSQEGINSMNDTLEDISTSVEKLIDLHSAYQEVQEHIDGLGNKNCFTHSLDEVMLMLWSMRKESPDPL